MSFLQNRNHEFLKRCFGQYYKSVGPGYPPRFTRREYGFFFFGQNHMVRHQGFRKAEDLTKFLTYRVPAHVYYSSAYYRDPEITPMSAKVEGWLGADLIFDLDADHLPNAEQMTFEEQLEAVKKPVENIIFDFLTTDFGFAEDKINLYFSGGRGYHIHIYDTKVLELDAQARQEIVDYIQGVGINLKDSGEKGWSQSNLYQKKTLGVQSFNQFEHRTYQRFLYPPDHPSWKGRVRRGLHDLIDMFAQMSEEDAVAYMQNLKQKSEYLMSDEKRSGFGKRTFQMLYHELRDHGDIYKQTGNMSAFLKDKGSQKLIRIAVAHSAVSLSGDVDEPVTKDTKRLIRLPGSIHGKTGFKVMPVAPRKLKEFDPLTDAVVFGKNPVKVQFEKDCSFRLKNDNYEFHEGQVIELPIYAGVFAVARRLAKLP